MVPEGEWAEGCGAAGGPLLAGSTERAAAWHLCTCGWLTVGPAAYRRAVLLHLPLLAVHACTQPIAATPTRFVFCSTMAAYVYDADDCRLLSIIARHEKQIVAVALSPSTTASLLACAISKQARAGGSAGGGCHHYPGGGVL